MVPIPSSRSRQREKGFNQCLLLTKELVKIDRDHQQKNFGLLENLLIKKIHTVRQVRIRDRQERLENLTDTFAINPAATSLNLSELSFILIDDVITTGATMTEAIRALKAAGAKRIVGFALAH